jgi:hypothetical protein
LIIITEQQHAQDARYLAPVMPRVRTNKMKTIRTILTTKRRRYLMAVILMLMLFSIFIVIGAKKPDFLLLGFLIIPVIIAILFGLRFSVRCPNCGETLAFALSWPPTWDLSVSKKIKFCKFCGVNLDKEIEFNNNK